MNQIASLVGFGPKAPKTSTASVVDTQAEQKKAKLARSALLSTEGGIMGSELQSGQVGGRSTLFGN